ncbi:MAG: hypothetical protein WC919_03935 [Candidatus Paceibacterota bacterium]|jgi:hypothetical protein
MKQVLSALVLAGMLAPVAVVLAQPEAPTLIGGGEDLINLINRIGNWIFALVLAVAAVFLIVAGFLFVTAGGNPENVNKARGMLINALIGVAIALGARGLVAVVASVLGYTG